MAGIDVSNHQPETALTDDGQDVAGAIAMGDADAIFNGTRKVVLSLTPPSLSSTPPRPSNKSRHALLCPTRSTLGFFSVPHPTLDVGEVLPYQTMQTQLVWKITHANVVTVTLPQTGQLQRQPAYMRGFGTTEVREM
jgi:hypothetical protein